MSKIQGKNLVVLLKDSSWKAVAYATTCELDTSAEMKPIGSQVSGGWAHVKPGKKSWRVTAGHLLSSASQPVDFKQLLDNGTRIQIAFTTVTDTVGGEPSDTPTATFNRSGYCYVSRETTTSKNKDYVTLSVEFIGDGQLFNDLHELHDFNGDFNLDFNNHDVEE